MNQKKKYNPSQPKEICVARQLVIMELNCLSSRNRHYLATTSFPPLRRAGADGLLLVGYLTITRVEQDRRPRCENIRLARACDDVRLFLPKIRAWAQSL